MTSQPANLALDLRPQITRQPGSVAARPGASVTLTVQASGPDNLSYQWFRNGVPIGGASGTALVLASLSAESEANYAVQVSNAAGHVMSATAVVRIEDWASIAGAYQALFVADEAATFAIPGRLTAKVTGRGSFSGRLEYEGLGYRLVGPLDPDFSFKTTIARPGQSAIRLALRFFPEGGEPRLSAEVGPVGFAPTAFLSTSRNNHHPRLNPALHKGRYVVALESTEAATGVPTAPGYATINVTAGGAVTLLGKLPDGAKLASGGLIGEDGVFACYQGLYRAVFPTAGQLAGAMSLEPIASDQAVGGSLSWTKPPQTSGVYKGGFSALLSLRGSLFVAPPSGETLLPVPQSSPGLLFSAEDVQSGSPFAQRVGLSARHALSAQGANPQKLSVKLDLRTGQVRGTFLKPGTRARHTLEGVLLPGTDAIGFFSTDAGAGTWRIAPE